MYLYIFDYQLKGIKMKKYILSFVTTLLFCISAQAAEPNKMNSLWQKISIYDVKNPATLFGEDWAALAVGNTQKMNAMTIGWGQFGTLWGRPVLTVYVAPERYTNELMENTKYFTVVGFPKNKKEALTYIGTHSGRDGDKLAAAGLTPEFTENGNPIFKEGNLAIECKIIYKESFKKELLDEKAKAFYDRTHLTPHVAYIGEVINVWEKTDK